MNYEQFEQQQRQAYAEHLADDFVQEQYKCKSFEQWLLAGFCEQQQALRDFYALFIEYDLNTTAEEQALEADGDVNTPDKVTWLDYLGVVEAVKVQLGIDRDPVPAPTQAGMF